MGWLRNELEKSAYVGLPLRDVGGGPVQEPLVVGGPGKT